MKPNRTFLKRKGRRNKHYVLAKNRKGKKTPKNLILLDENRHASFHLLFQNKTFLEELRSFEADLQVVVAFRMLPVVVWDMPKLGTINLHGSLLPKYRGAAPINWAIINGEKETGLCTFKLKQEIDTGDLIDCVKVAIDPDDTAGNLHDKMKVHWLIHFYLCMFG